MSRNSKPEFAGSQRHKEKAKPLYIGGLKIPTPSNSSFQCWCVTFFTLIGYHCYITTFPFDSFTISNCIGISLCAMVLYSLWMTWSTNAGTTPDKGWDKNDDSLVNSYGRPFCDKCQKYKPERTHHCKICDSCVLRMDHHCPFTDSCVGWYNYKYFFCLLFWGVVTMSAFLGVSASHLWKMIFGVAEGQPEIPMSWYFVLDFVAIIAGNIALLNLLITHIVFVLVDKTTIEWKETQHISNTFSYWGNLDIWKTCVKRTLGNNPLLWLIPTRISLEGDGVNFHKPFFRQVLRGSKDDPDAANYNKQRRQNDPHAAAEEGPYPEPTQPEV